MSVPWMKNDALIWSLILFPFASFSFFAGGFLSSSVSSTSLLIEAKLYSLSGKTLCFYFCKRFCSIHTKAKLHSSTGQSFAFAFASVFVVYIQKQNCIPVVGEVLLLLLQRFCSIHTKAKLNSSCKFGVDITWMYVIRYGYEVRVMVNDLDIVWHVYSTTYDCSLYMLTFWWSIDLTYKYLWHALFMVHCHLDLT